MQCWIVSRNGLFYPIPCFGSHFSARIHWSYILAWWIMPWTPYLSMIFEPFWVANENHCFTIWTSHDHFCYCIGIKDPILMPFSADHLSISIYSLSFYYPPCNQQIIAPTFRFPASVLFASPSQARVHAVICSCCCCSIAFPLPRSPLPRCVVVIQPVSPPRVLDSRLSQVQDNWEGDLPQWLISVF